MSNPVESDNTVKDISKRKLFQSGAKVASAPIRELTQSPKPPTKRVLGRHNANTANSTVSRRTFVKVAAGGAAIVGLGLLVTKTFPLSANQQKDNLKYKGKVTPMDRQAAAAARQNAAAIAPTVVPAPGGTPDYFGTTPNYAYSPMPTVTGTPVSGVTLNGFSVTSGGSGYTTPAVILTGGGGTGATATARVSNGVILGLVLTNPGTGYTSAPTVTFKDPSPRASGAVATAVFTSNVGSFVITGGIRKFIDSLPGLGSTGANNLGKYHPNCCPRHNNISRM